MIYYYYYYFTFIMSSQNTVSEYLHDNCCNAVNKNKKFKIIIRIIRKSCAIFFSLVRRAQRKVYIHRINKRTQVQKRFFYSWNGSKGISFNRGKQWLKHFFGWLKLDLPAATFFFSLSYPFFFFFVFSKGIFIYDAFCCSCCWFVHLLSRSSVLPCHLSTHLLHPSSFA